VKRSVILFACVIGLLLPSLLAPAMTVKATYKGKAASWQLPVTLGGTSYQLTNPLDLMVGKTHVGRLTSLSLGALKDPFLYLNFSIHADADANFAFDTGVLSFDELVNPQAYASAAATLTSDPDGATFKGSFIGNNAYEATYNGGVIFADLIDPFSAMGNTSSTQTDRLPLGLGFITIGGPVSSMRAQWSFSLTAGDDASGTSRFDIEPVEAVPDQGTIALAFAGVVPLLTGRVMRRRRRQ
jgi:hypothetical protein